MARPRGAPALRPETASLAAKRSESPGRESEVSQGLPHAAPGDESEFRIEMVVVCS